MKSVVDLVQTDKEIHMPDQRTQFESEQVPLIFPPAITSTSIRPLWQAGQDMENSQGVPVPYRKRARRRAAEMALKALSRFDDCLSVSIVYPSLNTLPKL